MKHEDFAKFFALRGVKARCEVCHQDVKWTTHGVSAPGQTNTTQHEYAFGLPMVKLDQADTFAEMLVFGIPVIGLECSNCGHIRLFNFTTVRRGAAEFDALQDAAKKDNGT